MIADTCGLFTLRQTRKQKAQDITKSGYHLQDLPQQTTLVSSAPPPKDSPSHKQHPVRIKYPDPTVGVGGGAVGLLCPGLEPGLELRLES